MGFLDAFKVRSALGKHQKGDIEQAFLEYEKLYAEGIISASYMLPYSSMLLRRGGNENAEKAKTVLVKAQKAADLSLDRRQQLLVNYSIACHVLGDREKAISTLEAAHNKYSCGLIYQTLGYLYTLYGEKEKALAYNTEALEYDEVDSVVLDNMGQMYYLLFNDKEKAKPYFEKAHKIKPSQIDTLYFLSSYDIENGDTKAAIEKLTAALDGVFSPLNHKSRAEIEEELNKLKAEK